MRFEAGQRVHVIGVGGFGMSAIARVLLLRGVIVSGSDKQANSLTAALERDGATIFIGHRAENIGAAQIVLRTSAVADDHLEVLAARERGIPVYKRREILAALMAGEVVVAIAGTHGKTTTTAMTTHILREHGDDPSYIVGGIMANTGSNAGVGAGGVFVIEADEYDEMFLGLNPNVTVLTNLEYDHPDFFASEEVMIAVFRQFIERLAPDGLLIACADDPGAAQLVDAYRGRYRVLTYGFSPAADVQITPLSTERYQVGEVVFELHLPGKHNMLNALAAALAANVPLEVAARALASYQSTGRRFEIRGVMDDIIVIDDYAHHPTAIRVTLEAARAHYPGYRVWAVWQPHMYSRTRELIGAIVGAFAAADVVLVTDIYAAREQPIAGINGAWVAGQIEHPQVVYAPLLADAVDYLLRECAAPAVIVVMSAGDATQISASFLEAKQG